MQISIVEKEGVQIVHLRGSLDTQTSPVADGRFREVLDGGATRVLADFRELDYITSAGIRVLLGAAKQLQGRGWFGICNLNENVREILEMTGLAGLVFQVYGSEDEALHEL
jgi:anti-anti-sigma factor